MKRPKVFRFLAIPVFFLNIGLSGAQQEQPITLKAPKSTVTGTITLPESAPKKQLLLIVPKEGLPVQGIKDTCSGTDSLSYILARTLAANGYASVRIPAFRTGSVTPEGLSTVQASPSDLAEEILLWINYLSLDRRFRGVVVAGHGGGALIGALALQRTKLSGGFISLEGMGPCAVEPCTTKTDPDTMAVSSEEFPVVETLAGTGSSARENEEQVLNSWRTLDAAEVYRKLKVPALIVQGPAGGQAWPEDTVRLSETLPNVKTVRIQGMGRDLKPESSKNSVTGTQLAPQSLHAQLAEELVLFLQGLR